MENLRDIGINIFSDLVLWLGLGLLVYLWLKIRKHKFLRFFGVEKNHKLVVYLSNLWQQSKNNSEGIVIAGSEFRVAISIQSLFGKTPFRVPELVRGLVDELWAGQELDYAIKVSPLELNLIEFKNMIVVGASPKNSVRRYYLKSGLVSFKIVGEKKEPVGNVHDKVLSSKAKVLKGRSEGQEITGNYNIAILEKVIDKENGNIVFMCVGCQGDSSWGATEYLVRNWKNLQKRFENNEFAICLGFPKLKDYMDKYYEPEILAMIPSGLD
jgi:hypothetical protein